MAKFFNQMLPFSYLTFHTPHLFQWLGIPFFTSYYCDRAFYIPGSSILNPILNSQTPTGIRRIVQKHTKPIPHTNTTNGTMINSQKKAFNNAPVTLNPSQNINDKNSIPKKKPIIYFFLLSFLQ